VIDLPPECPPAGTPLCRIDELADDGCRGFSVGAGKARFELFLVRKRGRLYGYVNECPHLGTPLELIQDRFLTRDKERLLCTAHGAEFRIEDGYCVTGPCFGCSLRPIPLDFRDGTIRIGG
jgi:nitrite reductase/ring-hydroxylating ferredoxin subunit